MFCVTADKQSYFFVFEWCVLPSQPLHPVANSGKIQGTLPGMKNLNEFRWQFFTEVYRGRRWLFITNKEYFYIGTTYAKSRKTQLNTYCINFWRFTTMMIKKPTQCTYCTCAPMLVRVSSVQK